MNRIKSNYTINENTLALLPAKAIDYDTIVLETDKQLKVRQPSLEIIKDACHNDWSTYEGKREAVIRHMNFKKKVPIPIDTAKGIYFFPTHGQHHFDNGWIAYQHIAHVTEINQDKTSIPQTIISFTNGMRILVDIPKKLIKNQMQRTFDCMYRVQGNAVLVRKMQVDRNLSS